MTTTTTTTDLTKVSLYSTECDQHGHLFRLNDGTTTTGAVAESGRSVYRMALGDRLTVHLPSGSLFAQLDSSINVRYGNGETREIPFERNSFGGGVAQVEALVGGLLQLSLRCRDSLTKEIINGPSSIIVITPRLTVTNSDSLCELAPEAICLLTVITQKLGPVSRWEKLLEVAVRQKFNAIHFTPVQQLGASNSSYSIADQLAVSDRLVSSNDVATGWVEFEATLKALKAKTQLNFFTDLVLNHTASNSAFLASHPECGYNEENSPWLRGAIELEEAIKKFNLSLTGGKYQQKYNIGSVINSEAAVDNLVIAFKEECLDRFDLGRWFSLDIEECLVNFKKARKNEAARTSSPLISRGEEFAWTEALRQTGVQSRGIVLSPDVIIRVSRDEHVLRNILHKVQERLWKKCDEIYQSVLASLRGTVRYERLECGKSEIDNTPWNSVLPLYFTPIKCDDGRELHLANNGWVMNWKCSEDFAGPGSLVYLGRQLVVWSDCVKLRYGDSRSECPFLWDHIQKYCETTAQYFDGIRLDNCHSTPIHVGKYMMERCRKVNPKLFVFAELFTGAEEDDVIFEKELGLNALVREAVQTSCPGDLAWHCQKYCREVYGEIPQFAGPMSFEENRVSQLRPSRRLNLFYDCTHDNKTPFENNRPDDLLACAAFVAASDCAVGSTYGYEVGLLKNPSVIADNTFYKLPARLVAEEEKISIDTESGNKIIDADTIDDGTTIECEGLNFEWTDTQPRHSVQLWGSFNNWSAGIDMIKADDMNRWNGKLISDQYSLDKSVEFKFVVDGVWLTSPNYDTQTDSKGNTNNIIGHPSSCTNENDIDPSRSINFEGSVGIVEARRILNGIHQYMAENGYTETRVEYPCNDLAVVSRHNELTGNAMYFFIRSHWWKGANQPEVPDVKISGKIIEVMLAAEVSMDYGRTTTRRRSVNGCIVNGEHRGLADETACVRQLSHEPHQWYEDTEDCTHLNFHYLPSGAVYIVRCTVNRNPVKAVNDIATEDAIRSAMEEVSLDDLNLLLWSCEAEEKDRAYGFEGGKDRGVYQFPGAASHCVYAGWTHVVDMSSRNIDERAHFSENVKAGNWLLDYHLDRLGTISSRCPKLVALMTTAVNKIKACSQGSESLKPYAVGLLFRRLYSGAQQRVLDQMKDSSLISNTNELLVKRLALASTQLLGYVSSSCLCKWSVSTDQEYTKCSMSAGLPFFTTGYMREWGRDTMLALPGLCLATGRWFQAEQELLAYASVIRHAMVPNLLDSGNNPRYNARDAVWFWLEALQHYVKLAPNGVDILSQTVNLKYGNNFGLEYDPMKLLEESDVSYPDGRSSGSAAITVSNLIHLVMSCHAKGIKYREWNAGLRIDAQMKDEGFNVSVAMNNENGFCVGGNELNCGTWMDKMGSSDKAGNRGYPSSSRHGAPVELTAACQSCLKWIVEELIPKGLFKWNAISRGCDGISYAQWKQLIDDKFDQQYYIDESMETVYPRIAIAKTYKDIWGGTKQDEDYFLRCNYAIGFAMAPTIAPKNKIAEALTVQYQRLMNEPNQIGMKTLDPDNYRYRPDYDNSNDNNDKHVAHGWNYHQGPEWIWPAGCWFTARIMACDPSNPGEVYYQCHHKIRNISEYIKQAPWFGLPELTNQNGSYCRDSCQTQAWSIATVLWYLHTANQILNKSIWTTKPIHVPATVQEPITTANTCTADIRNTSTAKVVVPSVSNTNPATSAHEETATVEVEVEVEIKVTDEVAPELEEPCDENTHQINGNDDSTNNKCVNGINSADTATYSDIL